MNTRIYKAGDTGLSGDCGIYEAGIHVDDWFQRIVVYGANPTEAEKLRDLVLKNLLASAQGCKCEGLCEQRGLASDEVDATCRAVHGEPAPAQDVEVRTCELVGPALDWAVAKCVYEKAPTTLPFDEFLKGSDEGNWGLTESEHDEIQALKDGYRPSTNWSQGGPLIERERIGLWPNSNGYFAEKRHFGRHHKAGRNYGEGPTPLIAAMRCLVAAKLGDTVQVPAELMIQNP